MLAVLFIGFLFSCKSDPGGSSSYTEVRMDIDPPNTTRFKCGGSGFVNQEFKYTVTVYTYDENLKPVVYSRKRSEGYSASQMELWVKLPTSGQYFYDIVCETKECEYVSDSYTKCENMCVIQYFSFSSDVYDTPIYSTNISFTNWVKDGYDCC